jgi:hypothetical protein
MAELTIETDSIKKVVIYFFAIVGVIAVGCVVAIYLMDHVTQAHPAEPVVAPAAVVPTPVPATTPSYPSVIEFTVLSTTVAYGHYEALTTDGDILYFADYTTWNRMFPHGTYTATITGEETNGAYDVGTVNAYSSVYNPPVAITSSNPSVLEFTVLSTTVINGHYEAVTTDGRILYFIDFSTWDSMSPGYTYTGTIIGEETNGAYDIGTVNLISSYNTPPGGYPVYYHYNGEYYRYDGHNSARIGQREVIGKNLIEAQPPDWSSR